MAPQKLIRYLAMAAVAVGLLSMPVLGNGQLCSHAECAVESVGAQKKCNSCKGKGYHEKKEKCWSCDGKGKWKETCSACNGKKLVRQKDKLFATGCESCKVLGTSTGKVSRSCYECNGKGTRVFKDKCTLCAGKGTY